MVSSSARCPLNSPGFRVATIPETTTRPSSRGLGHRPPALAKLDRRIPIPPRRPAEDDLVPIGQTGPGFPIRQRNGITPPARHLQQAPLGPGGRSRDRPVPETVPLPNRSPGWRLHPLEVWCATICATVQYSIDAFDRDSTPAIHAFVCSGKDMDTDLRRHDEGGYRRRVNLNATWYYMTIIRYCLPTIPGT